MLFQKTIQNDKSNNIYLFCCFDHFSWCFLLLFENDKNYICYNYCQFIFIISCFAILFDKIYLFISVLSWSLIILYPTHISLVLVSWAVLEGKIQSLILEAFIKLWPKCIQEKDTPKDKADITEDVPVEESFHIERNFDSLFSTIILFLEQEPYTSVPMNLDVNFWRFNQENFVQTGGISMKEQVFKPDGKSFQNSPIHLLFYEKVSQSNSVSPDKLKESPE